MHRDTLAQQQINAMEHNQLDVALAIARQSITDPVIVDILSFNSSGILINVGGHQGDQEQIHLGMRIAEGFLGNSHASDEAKARARYNLSNGYAALAYECEKRRDYDGRLKNWHEQRYVLHELVLDRKTIPADLITEVLTNFGNLLDEFGRTVEAIDIWSQVLQIHPSHPVAHGSLGQAYLRLLNIQPKCNVHLVEAARSSLEHTLSKPELIEKHAESGAAVRYMKSLDEAKAIGIKLAGSNDEFLARISRLKLHHKDWEADPVMKEWAQRGLLLTINPFPEWCPETLADDLYFDGLATTANKAGERRFTDLAHTLNQIKEDFALARYLLLASLDTDGLAAVSSVTRYADTLDYADFGLSSGMLKASIRTSVDIFDKIANFMNRYLGLGIPEKKVSFSSVWYDKGITDAKKRVEHPLLTPHLSHKGWLRGIRDVAENLNFYPAPSKDARNKVTHDFLIIENIVMPTVRLHGKLVPVDAHEYARQLLMMVKGAIVNLIAFVQREEGVPKQASSGIHASMEFRMAKGISDELAGSGQ